MNPEAGEALAEVKKEFVGMLPVPGRASWPKLGSLAKAMVALKVTAPSIVNERQQRTLARQIDAAVAEAFDLTSAEMVILENGGESPEVAE